ncbi:MAG: ATP-binding protein [Cyclobacteriaceae bacterium]
MEQLIAISNERVGQISLSFQRSFIDEIDWSSKMIGLLGARGTGKTTMLLQRMKTHHWKEKSAIYASLDDFYFLENRLYDFISDARNRGLKYLFLDEVHKYPGWARELKMAYDNFSDLKIIFTGSSIIELLKQDVDLSRRAVKYELNGFSFREFLSFEGIVETKATSLEDVIKSHIDISYSFGNDFRPLIYFQKYLEYGFYPFYKTNQRNYHRLLLQTIQLIIESDLQFIDGYDPRNARKVLQLLYILAKNVPFKPNITKLSEKIGIHRNTLVQYIHYLERASLIHSLTFAGKSINQLQKPDKILLNNPNLAYAISPETIDKGSLRESFFVSQVSHLHETALHNEGDFSVNDLVFEIGGKNKTQKQIKDMDSAFLALDEIEHGVGNKIPLWLFGLLY